MTAVGLLRHAQIIHNLQLFLEKEQYFPNITYKRCNKFSSDSSFKTKSSHNAIQDSQVVEPTHLQYRNQSDEVFHHNEFESQSEKSSYATSSCVDQSKTSIQEPINVSIVDDSNTKRKPSDDSSPYIEEIKCEENQTDYESFNLKDPNCSIPVKNSTEINEGLRKYSNITVPKKHNKICINRKRFEYFKSRILKRNNPCEKDRRVGSHGNDDICIDIEPGTVMGPVISTNSGAIRTVSTSVSKCTNYNEFNGTPQVSGIPRGVGNSIQTNKTNALSRKGSIVFKPGPVFTIPIQYNIPNQIKTKFIQNPPGLNRQSDARTSLPVTDSSGSNGNRPSENYSSQLSVPFVISKNNAGGENTEKPMLKIEPIEMNENNKKTCCMAVSAGNETYGGNIDLNTVSYIRRAYTEEDGSQTKANLINRRGNGYRKRRYPTTKPFKCEQCERAFNQRIHLKKHMSKHTGESVICPDYMFSLNLFVV